MVDKIFEINGSNGTAYVSSASSSSDNSAVSSEASNLSVDADNEDDLQTLEISNDDPIALIQEQGELNQSLYEQQIEQYKMQIENLKMQLSNIDTQRSTLLLQMSNPDADISSIMSEFNSISNSKFKIYSQIQSLTTSIASTQLKMQQDLLATKLSIQQMQSLANEQALLQQSYDSGLSNFQGIDTNSDVGQVAAQIGLSFVGVINNDAQGNAEFSPGGVSQHWCADFVTSITKRAYQAKGMSIPSGFGSSSVLGLQTWGKDSGVYLSTVGSSNKASLIANNVRPGDIMIQLENGASHTGIVTKVYPDGSFDTVEGNSSDAVKERHYSADSNILSGFILMNALG